MGSIYSLQYCRPAAVCAYEINFCRRSLLIAYSFTLRYRIKSSIFCNHQNRRLFIDVFSPHVLLLRRIILYRCCQSRSLSLSLYTHEPVLSVLQDKQLHAQSIKAGSEDRVVKAMGRSAVKLWQKSHLDGHFVRIDGRVRSLRRP